MVEQNSARGVQAIGFTVVPCEIESGHLGDPIGRARMKRSGFVLWRNSGLAKHLTGASKVEPGLWRGLTKRGKHVMGAVDVGVQSGELVLKRVADEALRGEMVDLIWLHIRGHAED